MNLEYNFSTSDINKKIDYFGNNTSFLKFLEKEIDDFLSSKKRNDMLVGERYFLGQHDILRRKRTILGKDGDEVVIETLPNNRIVDNQYARMVEQKNSYLLSKPITFYSDDDNFLQKINSIFNRAFFRTIKNIGEDAINCGIAWLYIFIDEKGELRFKKFSPYEVLPIWSDEEHTKLEYLLRIYDIEIYENKDKKIATQVELYLKEGIEYYILENRKLVKDMSKGFKPYIYNSNNNIISWGDIPVISFKFNSKEIPLINRIKTLQDALNTIKSDFMNNMQEDARNTILVLKNYDGTNLAEFRKNLAEYGVIKVKTIDGSEGGVETLKVEVDSSNYDILAKNLKKAIIENARGYDCKEEKSSQNLNQMNIRSIYSDINLDTNLMESEFQASFEDIFWFLKRYFRIATTDNFDLANVEAIFNRDMLINENEVIDNCLKSLELLSKETVLSKHPWVFDVQKELKK